MRSLCNSYSINTSVRVCLCGTVKCIYFKHSYGSQKGVLFFCLWLLDRLSNNEKPNMKSFCPGRPWCWFVHLWLYIQMEHKKKHPVFFCCSRAAALCVLHLTMWLRHIFRFVLSSGILDYHDLTQFSFFFSFFKPPQIQKANKTKRDVNAQGSVRH